MVNTAFCLDVLAAEQRIGAEWTAGWRQALCPAVDMITMVSYQLFSPAWVWCASARMHYAQQILFYHHAAP